MADPVQIDGYKAEGQIPVEGRDPIVVRCGWTEIAEARKRFGPEWGKKLGDAFDSGDVEVMAEFVEVFSRGEVSKAEVMDLSPPLRIVGEVVWSIAMAARLGPDWRAELEKGEAQAKKDDPGPLAASLTLLRWLSAWRSMPASSRPSSGPSRPGAPGSSSSSANGAA
ncbi:MAG: hypothetical protein R3349_01130 [Geminicoccaceae bacterium]|nr:hypothetical protein [Geminicoccaceae bacterium]